MVSRFIPVAALIYLKYLMRISCNLNEGQNYGKHALMMSDDYMTLLFHLMSTLWYYMAHEIEHSWLKVHHELLNSILLT